MRLGTLFSLDIYKGLSLCNHILITSKFFTSLTLRMLKLTIYLVELTCGCGEFRKIFIEHLESPSIDSEEEVRQIEVR